MHWKERNKVCRYTTRSGLSGNENRKEIFHPGCRPEDPRH